MKILSFDVGGSKIAWALINENGNILNDVTVIQTPKTSEEIENIFVKVVQKNIFDGFSVATAGVVLHNKLVGKPNNLPSGYESIDFKNIAKVPYVIENDANSAMWAEYKIGSLKNVNHGVMLTLGTDVGCGIICNGQILRGKCGAAGEVVFDCSGRSLQRIALEAGSTEQDCFAIYNMALKQNGAERKAYKIWQEKLLDCIQKINQVLDTEVVVLSGSLAKIVDYTVVNASIKLLQPYNAPEVKSALCGSNAGLIGSALICAQNLKG
ncbi:MAG: ROK family protein [Alphaproteobacteria bacterium]|nr:ROK family protein [Alphaproteobacteria bacterium]